MGEETRSAATGFDPAAIGSDIPRSRTQYLARRIAEALVRLCRLNRASPFATEIVQSIQPIAEIATAHGVLYARAGHGRLLWRARTFHSEEPETIAWLDRLSPVDVLWDVGANVGLYAVYAARFRRCSVLAIEPEAQNFALLAENIALNGVGERCRAACLAISRSPGLGQLEVRYLTKGGAYNQFRDRGASGPAPFMPQSVETEQAAGPALRQVVYGLPLDDLAYGGSESVPTHLKIDVDGLEPDIIAGARRLLSDPALKHVLIELNMAEARDREVPGILETHGFSLVSQRSNWQSRTDRQREQENPTTNMIFARVG